MGGGGTTTQTTTQELSPEQRKLLEPVIPIATGMLEHPPVQYPGTAIAPVTPAETQAQGMGLQAAGGMLPFTQQLPQMLAGIMGGQGANVSQAGANSTTNNNNLMSMLQSMIGGTTGQIAQGNAATQPALGTLMSPDILNAASNPALQSYMDAALRPLNQQYSNITMPQIAGDAVTTGYGGSRQGIAQGLASQGLSMASGDTTAKIANEGYSQGLQAMLGGVNASNVQQGNTLDALSKMFGTGVSGLLGGAQNDIASSQQQAGTLSDMMKSLASSPDILASMTKPAEITSAVGAQQRANQQAQLTETVQKFINEQMLPFTLAQDVAGMAFGMPGGTTTSVGSTSGGGGGISQILGVLPALFGLFGASDRRLKENIEPIAELDDGLKIYTYNFLHENRKRTGLMADEVQKVYPEAVHTDSFGFLYVDYGRVPTWPFSLEAM